MAKEITDPNAKIGFARRRDGVIEVTGNPNPEMVARAIVRSKEKRRLAPKNRAVRKRMAAKLKRIRQE